MNSQSVFLVESRDHPGESERKLHFFLQYVPLLRECRLCGIVAQVLVKSIEQWCRKDEKRWNLLGVTKESLGVFLEAVELRDRYRGLHK